MNLLSKENSPYLLQHADNPVDWMPWCEQSLALARQNNKPILLSIGYSACHWCHVMAHESFEDTETAKLMNALFINIKVDKEERPDLDKIYQNAHSLLTERPGGWPLTLVLTPDTQMPIFAGTYFPKEQRHGLPAFKTLLQHISDIWQTRQFDIQQQSNSLQSTYQHIYEASKPIVTEFNRAVIDIARNQVEQHFDMKNGGFSRAPKFPHPAIMEFALKHWCYTKQSHRPDPRILHCAIFTLEKMADGGIFDHLGGGFCRYSTDESWMIPHFEKMLYDNGPLLSLYSQAWKLNANPLFHDAACETANWVIREMQSPQGGYYSAQDADSEGVEGKFFIWSKKEIHSLLDEAAHGNDITQQDIEIFKSRFGLNSAANFEDHWHLHGYQSESALAKKHKMNEQELHAQLHRVRLTLFKHRENRIHPATDTKILTAWNGLMIHGMSLTGRLLNKPAYTESAVRAALFLKTHCWQNGQLFASYKDGKAKLNAYLDDYAFLLYGLLELLQNQWHNELYSWALQLADKLLSDFEDASYGAFFFTSHHHEALIQRLKAFNDDAIPAGNAIAALALNRLGYLSGEQAYVDAAARCLKSAWTSMTSAPISHSAMLNALSEYLTPPNIAIIRSQDKDAANWASLSQQYYLPFTLIYNIPANETLHPSLAGKLPVNISRAYPCTGMNCHPPIESAAEFDSYLRNNSYRVLE